MLIVTAHPIPGYTARTEHNAQVSDVTIAFAVDYSTGGELLTRKAAGDRYMAAPLPTLTRQTVLDTVTPARKLFDKLSESNGRIVNVAGNSIRRLYKRGWRQELCDAYVLRVLRMAHKNHRIEKIVSGGQTGIDLSGAIAGVVLGIPTELTMPPDLRQRPLYGPDVSRTKAEIEAMIYEGAERLQQALQALQARTPPAPEVASQNDGSPAP